MLYEFEVSPSKIQVLKNAGIWCLVHSRNNNFRIQEGPVNSKTKAIIFNNPNNPLGKVFQREEIEEIANLCKKHNVLVISDDVYEHMVFEGNEMIRMATLPDMYERTITIGSAGKTFSVTGWKLGWALGPAHLLQNCQVEHGPSN